MEENLVKKRGRKKKIHTEKEVKEPVKQPPEINENYGKRKVVGPESLKKIKKALSKKMTKVKSKLGEFDEYTSSKTFKNLVQAKFMDMRYKNYMQRNEGIELEYLKLYEKIKSGVATDYERQTWDHAVTECAIQKVCAVIDHLLMSGPLTDNESSILYRCISLFKLYYRGRYSLFINNFKHARYYQNTSFIPDKNSIVREIFITESQTPLTTLLYDPEDEVSEFTAENT